MQSSTLAFIMATSFLVIFNLDKVDARMTMAQIKSAVKGPSKKCAAKTGTTQEMLDQPAKGILPSDPSFQCYLQCIFAAMKAVNKAGMLDYDNSLKQIKSVMPLDIIDKSIEVADICFPKLSDAEMCQRAYDFIKCGWEIDPCTSFRDDKTESTSTIRNVRRIAERKRRIHRDVNDKITHFESSKGRCSRRGGVPRCTGLSSYRKQP